MKKILLSIPQDEINDIQELDSVLETFMETSDFKRMLYRLLHGKSHRGTIAELDDELADVLLSTRFDLVETKKKRKGLMIYD